jgi:hypothetical protein
VSCYGFSVDNANERKICSGICPTHHWSTKHRMIPVTNILCCWLPRRDLKYSVLDLPKICNSIFHKWGTRSPMTQMARNKNLAERWHGLKGKAVGFLSSPSSSSPSPSPFSSSPPPLFPLLLFLLLLLLLSSLSSLSLHLFPFLSLLSVHHEVSSLFQYRLPKWWFSGPRQWSQSIMDWNLWNCEQNNSFLLLGCLCQTFHHRGCLTSPQIC